MRAEISKPGNEEKERGEHAEHEEYPAVKSCWTKGIICQDDKPHEEREVCEWNAESMWKPHNLLLWRIRDATAMRPVGRAQGYDIAVDFYFNVMRLLQERDEQLHQVF